MNEENIIKVTENAEREADVHVFSGSEQHGAEDQTGNVAFTTGSSPFSHADFGDEMISRRRMCFIDGVPAVWGGMQYLVGKEAVYSAMIDMNRNIKANQRNEVMSYLELKAPRIPIADPKFIAFENGVLDIETLDLLACTPDLAITNVIPHKWNPDAVCLELDAALDAWTCNHKDKLKLVEEVVGLCVYRGRVFQVCLILLGEGSNGKSTFLVLLRRAIGEHNVIALDIKSMGARFQSVALMGKLANIADDISSEFVSGNALSTFKKVVTGEPINAEYKGGATFDFRPYCTVVLSANKMPRLKDSDEGIMRRFAPLRFEAKFSASQGNLDINLPRILESEAACERLLYRGVMALREALQRGRLTEAPERTEIIDEIRQDNSSVYEFACEELLFGTEHAMDIAGIPTKELFDSYREHCSESMRHPLAHGQFTKEMCAIFGVKSDRQWMDFADGKKKQVRCFVRK